MRISQPAASLPSVYRVLIESPEPWAPRPLKFKTPWEWSVSALRAMDLKTLDPPAAANLLRQLGQPTWQPGSPAGWDDLAASWAGPDALVRRVEVAQRLADRAGRAVDARALAEQLFPGSLSEATRTSIARAESPAEGLRTSACQPRVREEVSMLTRRTFVACGTAASAFAVLGSPSLVLARANTDRRFVFIIQRGAADGLSIVAPTGDPAFAAIRGDLAQDFGDRNEARLILHSSSGA